MAIYHVSINTVSRSSGHSATAKIAYNCRDKVTDIRTGEVHKYNSAKMRSDLLHSEITCGDAVLSNKERSEIWNNAELAENRSNSRTAREYVLALPKELTLEENIALVREFSQVLTSKYGNVADLAIHDESDGNGNVHAHILTTTRKFDIETKQLGSKTDLELDNGTLKKQGKLITQEQIKEIRKSWETIQNKHLDMAGLDLAVSCARKEDRETVKKHLGKEAVALERQGVETELGNYNRVIDDVIVLEHQIFNDGNHLAKERAELQALESLASIIEELQKQEVEQKRQDEELRNQQIQLARQQELMRLERLQQEQAKLAEEKKQAELNAREQEQIARLKVPADNFITAQHRYKLFDIAREHKEFFTKQTTGDYEYWTTRNGDIDVHKTHININKQSDESIKLALDVAVSQFGDKLNINGNDDFIKATIEIIANDERYANVSLDKLVYQEILESKRLSLQIKNARFILTDSKTGKQIPINTNEDVLKHFEQYDKNNNIAKWRESGLIETKSQFHYLDTHNPERVASVLNHEFKTDVKVEPNAPERAHETGSAELESEQQKLCKWVLVDIWGNEYGANNGQDVLDYFRKIDSLKVDKFETSHQFMIADLIKSPENLTYFLAREFKGAIRCQSRGEQLETNEVYAVSTGLEM